MAKGSKGLTLRTKKAAELKQQGKFLYLERIQVHLRNVEPVNCTF